jgi:hypothetical protein
MLRLLVASFAFASLISPASAHHRQPSHHNRQVGTAHHRQVAGLRRGYRHGRAWCGIYMRHVFGIADPRLNLARNWAKQGSSAGGPHVGAVVVWPHHVGVIRGGPDGNGQWLVESGNDGNAVRTRYRSLRGAIAFRFVGGGGFATAQSYSPIRPRMTRSRWPNQFADAAVNQEAYAPVRERRFVRRARARHYSRLELRRRVGRYWG